MKATKRLLAILLAAVLVLAMGSTAFAAGDEENPSSYEYEIYQIFTGTYSADTGELTDVKWGQNAKIPAPADGEEKAEIGDPVPEEVLKELAALTDAASDSEKLAVITGYADLKESTPIKTVSGTGENLTVSDLADGYYLIKDRAESIPEGSNNAYTTYVVTVVNGSMSIHRKAGVPTVEKKITEGENKADANEASIGDSVSYEITGTLPANLADYNTYYYAFTDTLSKGLTYSKDVVVTVDGIDMTEYFYREAVDDKDGTTITVAITDLLALNLLTDNDQKPLVTLTEDSKIVITYSAVLNEDAVIAGGGNTNSVLLAYSNDPNHSGEGALTPPEKEPGKPDVPEAYGETPKSTVTTYTTELTILKTDEDGQVLTGAEFTLDGEGVNIVLVTAETFTEAADGEYYKLADGTYTTAAPGDLYESLTDRYSYDEESGTYTQAADGAYWKLKTAEGEAAKYTAAAPDDMYDSTVQRYAKSTVVTAKGSDQAETTVTGSIDEGGHVTFTGLGAGTYVISETVTPAGYNRISPIRFTVSWSEETGFAVDNDTIKAESDNTLFTMVINKKGSFLPSTGGIGTTVFYILGAILVVGAGVLLVTKRRMREGR